MTESELETPTDKKFGVMRRLWSAWQWLVAVILALIAILSALIPGKLSAPGAPVAEYWSAVAALAVVAVSLCPPAFFRLPKAWKWLAYIAILPAFFFVVSISNQVQAAYERTPEGAKEVAENEADRQAQAKLDQIAARQEAEAQAQADRQSESIERKEKEEAEIVAMKESLTDCMGLFSSGISSLNDAVAQSLHNPDAFKHVETNIFLLADANVELIFQAENGFGAIRKNSVHAEVDPDTCEVVSVGSISQI